MLPAKLKLMGQGKVIYDRTKVTSLLYILDLHRQMTRRGVPYREPQSHPQKTVQAMRLLSAISDHDTRVGVSRNLYQVQ